MVVLLALGLVFAISAIGAWTLSESWNHEGLWIVSLMVAAMSGLGLAGMLIDIPMNHYGVRRQIEQFEATRRTVAEARANGASLENAALQLQIIQSNQWLAGVQYSNARSFGFRIPDEVDQLAPIR